MICAVTNETLPLACAVMNEAAHWMRDKGMPLWFEKELTADVMQKHVDREELYLAFREKAPAGTIILQDRDEKFWPEITDGSSLFFHKLAVSRKFAGQGVSRALMEFAYEQALACGKKFLRMDCSARHPLRRIYEAQGFEWLDQKHVGHLFVDRMFKSVRK